MFLRKVNQHVVGKGGRRVSFFETTLLIEANIKKKTVPV